MHRSGKFDVTDDSRTCSHVTDCQPITKSLVHLRPDKLYHKPVHQSIAINDAVRCGFITSGVILPAAATEGANRIATVNEISATGNQPRSSTANVPKSGEELKPEVISCQQNQAPASKGSLRDRWRLLNDEFKRLYQLRATSPETSSPPQGHDPTVQSHTEVKPIRRFKDIDQRFSNVSRAVGNMRARQLHSIATSGRTAASVPEVVTNGERSVQMPDTEVEYVSECPGATAHLYSSGPGDLAESTSEQIPVFQRYYLPTESGSQTISWYLDLQSSINGQSKSSSSLRKPVPGRVTRNQSEQCAVLPPGECEYNATKYDGSTLTWSTTDDADDGNDSSSEFSSQMTSSRSRDTTPLLMTSSPRRCVWSQSQRQGSRPAGGYDIRQQLRRRCACGCTPSPPPTALDKPEEEIVRSRDRENTRSQCWGEASERCDRQGETPAIEMTRQQVLNVYVLDERRRTGNDVTGHVMGRWRRGAVSRSHRAAAVPTQCWSEGDIVTVSAHGRDRPSTSVAAKSVTDRPERRLYRVTKMGVQPTRTVTTAAGQHSTTPNTLSLPKTQQQQTALSRTRKQSDATPAVHCTSLERKQRCSEIKEAQKRSDDASSKKQSKLRQAVDEKSAGPEVDVTCCNALGGGKADYNEKRKTGRSSRGADVRSKSFAAVNQQLSSSLECVGTTRGTKNQDNCAGGGRSRSERHGDDAGQAHRRKGRWVQPVSRSSHGVEVGQRSRDHAPADVSELKCRSLERPCSSSHERDMVNSRWNGAANDGEVEEVDCRWIKRQIHLPVRRRTAHLKSRDMRRHKQHRNINDDDDAGHNIYSERSMISSRTDPDNVCFGQRSSDQQTVDMQPLGGIVHRTPQGLINHSSAARNASVLRTHTKPTVRVQYATDDNGNVLKVYNNNNYSNNHNNNHYNKVRNTDDHRESAFLFQRLSALFQRYNSVAVLGIPLPTQPPRIKCSRSSTCSSF